MIRINIGTEIQSLLFFKIACTATSAFDIVCRSKRQNNKLIGFSQDTGYNNCTLIACWIIRQSMILSTTITLLIWRFGGVKGDVPIAPLLLNFG